MLGKKKKKPNSQWHLAVICASVYHCSSNSDSDFNNNNGSSLGYILKGRLVDVFSSQAGNNSHFSSLPVTFAASGLTEQTVHIKAECRCSCEASVSVLHLNPKSLLQHNTQAITWPQHGGRITYLMGLRCNHNQVTQHRLLSVQCTVHHFSTQVFFFLKCSPTLPWGCPPPTGRKETKHFIYVIYLIYVHSLYFSSVWVSLLLFTVELVSLFCSLFHHWGQSGAGEVRITSVMVTNRLGRERHDNLLIDLVFSYF